MNYSNIVQTELMKIPGVGKSIAHDFMEMGFTSIKSLKRQNPQAMYDKHCAIKGCKIDRCFLYVCRCAIYFANNTIHDPEKLKWYYWKDKK